MNSFDDMQRTLKKILDEVDPDIKEWMLSTETTSKEPRWALFPDPARTAIDWQRMRMERAYFIEHEDD